MIHSAFTSRPPSRPAEPYGARISKEDEQAMAAATHNTVQTESTSCSLAVPTATQTSNLSFLGPSVSAHTDDNVGNASAQAAPPIRLDNINDM